MSSSGREKKVIFSLFGPPGSGKGTLAQRLKAELGFTVLSMGDLCRQHVAQNTVLGKEMSGYLKKGALIPDGLIMEMVCNWFTKQDRYVEGIILDGYPRTRQQAERFLEWSKKSIPNYCFRVIVVNLSDDDIVKRLALRRVCGNKSCQHVYSGIEGVHQCVRCGSTLVRRDDDREDVVRKRLKLYPSYRDSLLDYYQTVGQYVEELSVEDMTIDQVFHTFKAML